jgi:uncharacterized membrane protein (GlpM family)
MKKFLRIILFVIPLLPLYPLFAIISYLMCEENPLEEINSFYSHIINGVK